MRPIPDEFPKTLCDLILSRGLKMTGLRGGGFGFRGRGDMVGFSPGSRLLIYYDRWYWVQLTMRRTVYRLPYTYAQLWAKLGGVPT